MTKADFARLNEDRRKWRIGICQSAQCCCWLLRQLDTSITAKRPLSFYAFEIFADKRKESFLSQEESEKALQRLGFSTSPCCFV